MKHLATTLTVFALTLSAIFAQSSSFFIGANGGVNFSKFRYTVDLAELYSNSTSLTGLNGGISAGFRIRNFSLSSGVNYIQKGGHYETDNFSDLEGIGFFSADEKLHFVSVPVLLGYQRDFGRVFGVSLAMGPTFNMGFSGKIDEFIEYYGTEDVSVEHYTARFGTSVNDDYRSMQLGFQFSPGIYFWLNDRSKLTFNVSWDSGLTDNFNPRYKQANTFFDDFRGNQLNRSTMLTIGYEFHLSFEDKY